MTPSQWNRVSDLFASAAEIGAAERIRLLEKEDEDVRSEVERMLRENQRSGLLDRDMASSLEEDRWSGKVLNARYRIERFLARGGAGEVYLARDAQVANRAAVVKFLSAWARSDGWLKKKFREEMEALARINHPSVVGILDAGETADGLPFLVIEYIDGITLRAEIQQGPMDAARVARLIRDIARGVFAAHEKGVLHRDLKPENIMLERARTAAETVRLIDFGIARVERPDQDTLTHTTRFAGTTMYMAPEQLAGRPQPASDIYAIGVLAYEMLCGRRPFVAASPVELYQQQRAGVKSEIHRARPEIPAAAVRMIVRQLSFRPEDRSATALEAGEQISAALEGRLSEPWSRRHFAGALTGGAGVIAAGAYIFSRSRPLDPSERVIEVLMGTEVLEYGFKKDLDIDYHVLQNADATAYDSIRVVTGDQGSYFHPLSAAQARAAHADGWKLTIEAALEAGDLAAGIDNPLAPARFIMQLLRNPDQTDSATCLLHAVPVRQTISRVLPGPAGARHQLDLIWKPSNEAELWVDGARSITGYTGERNYRYARGLTFGTDRYRSAKGAGVFWKIRLEIGLG